MTALVLAHPIVSLIALWLVCETIIGVFGPIRVVNIHNKDE